MGFFNKKKFAVFYLFIAFYGVSAQELEHIPPVLPGKQQHRVDTSVSFIFSALDLHEERFKLPQKYFNGIQIFDEDVSWPPRWYYAFPAPLANYHEEVIVKSAIGDTKFQNGFYTFFYRLYKRVSNANENSNDSKEFKGTSGIVRLNMKMEPVDTIIDTTSLGIGLSPHDFRVNKRGERLMVAYVDSFLDISESTGNPGDTSVPASIPFIEILNPKGEIIFKWDAAKALGSNSLYFKGITKKTYFKLKNFDWAHVTGALWDTDGNILYCFRFVGVGKISRQDGHVIWRLNNKDLPIISGSDTINFYSQHDFEVIGDTGVYSYYSLFSDGKEPDKLAEAIILKVNNETNEIKIATRFQPDERVITAGAGSYEAIPSGDYLLSYGQYPYKDSSDKFHYFMELRDSNRQVLNKYSLPGLIFTYKVFELTGTRPPRPVIKASKNKLLAQGEMRDWTWYKLDGENGMVVTLAGHGSEFVPRTKGTYCVAGKYGIGWSVSKPLIYPANK